MKTWRLLDRSEPARGAWNMALDDALFQAAESGLSSAPVVRLYTWAPPCLSLGFHQALREACDEAFCREAGIDIVRRPTGGKAVLHADEVTYSVVAPSDAIPFSGLDLRGAYEVIARALLEALRSLGLPAGLEERAVPVSPKGGQPCFQTASEKEVVVGGRKVTGSAQRRGKRAFLQHGAIPLRLDYELLAGATGRTLEEAAAFRTHFAGVADVNPGITRPALREALEGGFARIFGGSGEKGETEAREEEEAERLMRTRYSADSWTRMGKDLEDLRRLAGPVSRDGGTRDSNAQGA